MTWSERDWIGSLAALGAVPRLRYLTFLTTNIPLLAFSPPSEKLAAIAIRCMQLLAATSALAPKTTNFHLSAHILSNTCAPLGVKLSLH